MAKVSERVRRMMAEFIKRHNEGYTIPQIAKIYNLDSSTIYLHLQEIADANGVERRELLERPRNATTESFWQEEERKVRVDVEALKNGFSDVKSSIQGICNKIDKLLSQEEN